MPPVVWQLSLGESRGAEERSYKWFLPPRGRVISPGGRARSCGRQEKEVGLPGVGSPGSPCRCGGEGSGASWCRRQTPKEAVLVCPPPAALVSACGGAPRFSPAASSLQQLGGTVPGPAARHGIRLSPASAAQPGTRRGGGGGGGCSSAGMSDCGEGIVSLPVPSPPGGGPPCEEALGRRAQGADAGARSLLPDLAAPPPGTLWAEDGAAATAPGIAARAKGGGRRTAVTYVINEASQGPLLAAESGALQSLREACEVVGAALETLHFGKLDFGETAVLDRFYNAGESGAPGLRAAAAAARPGPGPPSPPWPGPPWVRRGAAGAGVALPRCGVSSGRGALRGLSPAVPPGLRRHPSGGHGGYVGSQKCVRACFCRVPSRPPLTRFREETLCQQACCESARVIFYLWVKRDPAVVSQSPNRAQGARFYQHAELWLKQAGAARPRLLREAYLAPAV